MSIGYTSPVTKILSCLHGATHDEPAAFVLHLIFHFFISTKLLLRTRHPSGSRLSEFNVCSPWHIIMPQKTFSSIPCPIDLSISRLVAQKVQPIMAHGMGKTASHAIFTMTL
jgi:hypothetical protein